MKSLLLSIIVAISAALFIACEDTSQVGNILDKETVVIVIDSNFTVTGTSVANPVVQSRTITQLLGNVTAPAYGSINSDFVAQFMPSNKIDTVSVTAAEIDSIKCFLQMLKDEFTGDSLVPMGVNVYRLTTDLPYPIHSGFNPADYYDPTPIGNVTYTASRRNEPDSILVRNSKAVVIDLPVDLGKELFNAYVADPTVYNDPDRFCREVFRGLYFANSYGSGRICNFTTSSLRLYYHKTTWNEDSARYETTNHVGDYWAITPEVIINNNINYTPDPSLVRMVDEGANILAAPAGYQMELTFPGREVVESYNRYKDNLRVLNSLTLEIPADSIGNDYNISPPPYTLLVLKNKADEFFASNTVPDEKTAFYAAYNSSTHSYVFSGMRGYLQYLLSLETITDDDLTFILTPVQLNSETSSSSSYYYYSQEVVTSVVPYVSKPAMALISLDRAKIKLTFSANTGINL